MRFGKKLALFVLQDEREGRVDRPYISHKLLKQCLAETIKELKELEESANLNSRILQLRNVILADLQRIKSYVIIELESLVASVNDLAIDGDNLGISDKRSLHILLEAYKKVLTDSCTGLHAILSDSVLPFWVSLSTAVASLCDKYIGLVDAFRSLVAYLEINVAGFRKILKQMRKQLPGFPVGEGDFNYVELALLVVPTRERIDKMRCNIQSITDALSSATTPLPLVEFGTETMLALSAQEIQSVKETQGLPKQISSSPITNITNIHL